MKRLSFLVLACLVIICLGSIPNVDAKNVTITNMGSYFKVIIDYTKGGTAYEIGAEYMKLVRQIFPEFESNLDAYFLDLEALAEQGYVATYPEMIRNAQLIKSQIPPNYIDEIEGLATGISNTKDDIPGDGKLSKNEIYVFNLIPDVCRAHSCSGISFFGDSAKTGNSLTGRNLDWMYGIKSSLCKLHTVTVIKNRDKSICLIGFLGGLSAITAINDNGVFAAILDSSIGSAPINCKGKNSYSMDLRYTLENFDNLNSVANYMIDKKRQYSFNHNILLSDPTNSKIVENNMALLRKVRSYDSDLNPGIEWDFDETICVVNSFVLNANTDNHTGSGKNSGRWNNFYKLTKEKPYNVTFDDVKKIMAYHEGEPLGHIYRGPEYEMISPGFATIQQVIFEPNTMKLEVYFRPETGSLAEPDYEAIDVDF
ncbi:MAG: hypothetical protein GY874_21050 [Desulfobacteraceae bacterium]|nr:hypothetical protein [Desulfobacteraceae bacterium]